MAGVACNYFNLNINTITLDVLFFVCTIVRDFRTNNNITENNITNIIHQTGNVPITKNKFTKRNISRKIIPSRIRNTHE